MEKYFLINNYTGFSVFIYEKDYEGVSTEIFGKVSFDKGSVKDILDPIRGTGLSLQLQADSNLTFEEFSEADEKTYMVTVTKNNQTFFKGFLKPDGITQSFVQDIWIINLDFVDGLGVLKDLAFVNSAGNNFVGKLSMFQIIEACLARTELVMSINSSVKLKYLGYSGTNILKDTYLNADRFYKKDAQASTGGTTMTCEEVLNSVLNIVSACITQQDGAWWIYRPNEFDGNVVWTNNTTDTTFTKNLSISLGSQIDNFYPHHCNGNQQIETKGAVSAYRINYKYGFKSGILLNPTLIHDSNLIFEDWTKSVDIGDTILINDPNDDRGLIMKTKYALFGTYYNILQSDPVFLLAGSQIDFTASMFVANKDATTFFQFRIHRSDNYRINQDGQWVAGLTGAPIEVENTGQFDFEWTLKCEPVPNDCTVYVIIRNVQSSLNDANAYNAEIKSANIISNYNYDGKVGEFHTITRSVSPSSITKENQEVYNGDSIGDVFEGAIYKSDQQTLTTLWTRNDWIEEKRILQISGEDDMRIAQKTQKVFIGDFYGYVPYLSIVSINNLVGKFMFIEHSYDTDSNITRAKLKQFYTDEVGGLLYALSYDYGNTVKPSIKS
jgi:hypothetical protein